MPGDVLVHSDLQRLDQMDSNLLDCTEAVRVLVEFGLGEYGLTLVYVRHLRGNRSSGRVILKNGFQHRGTVSIDVNGETRVVEHYEKSSKNLQIG